MEPRDEPLYKEADRWEAQIALAEVQASLKVHGPERAKEIWPAWVWLIDDLAVLGRSVQDHLTKTPVEDWPT